MLYVEKSPNHASKSKRLCSDHFFSGSSPDGSDSHVTSEVTLLSYNITAPSGSVMKQLGGGGGGGGSSLCLQGGATASDSS